MKKKIPQIIVLVLIVAIVVALIFIPKINRYQPIDIEGKKLHYEKMIYYSEEIIPENYIEPDYVVKDNILSYSMVGQFPLNNFGYTDIGNVYESELTGEFDNLFKNNNGWIEGYNADYFIKNSLRVIRADVLDGLWEMDIQSGERFYYILFVKDDIYICRFYNEEIGELFTVTVGEEI